MCYLDDDWRTNAAVLCRVTAKNCESQDEVEELNASNGGTCILAMRQLQTASWRNQPVAKCNRETSNDYAVSRSDLESSGRLDGLVRLRLTSRFLIQGYQSDRGEPEK